MVDILGLFRQKAAPVVDAEPILEGSPQSETAEPTLDAQYSRSGELWTVPSAWLKQFAPNDDTVLQREGSQDLKLFDALLDDDVCMSNFQQRRLAVVSRDWEVVPGDEKDPRSVKAADRLRENLKTIDFDRITDKMLYAVWYGYGVAEGMFQVGDDGLIELSDIIVPDRRWFGFTADGELILVAGLAITGEVLPENKFWALRSGGTHDFAFYGLGLAHWAYWPVWFKRSAMQFWALYLEKFGMPTAIGEYKETATTEEKDNLLIALTAMGRDRAVRFPEGYVKDELVKFVEGTRAGGGMSGYKDFVTEQNEALMRIVLGQPGSSKATPQGIGGKQAEVHDGVKKEIVKADSDLFCGGFNGTFSKWLTRWNFGPGVKPPRVFRKLDDEEDLNTVAERDAKLKGLGWVRTEDSFKETYGEGYEKAPEPEPILPGLPGGRPMNANPAAKKPLRFDAHDPRPLYVYRKLLNAEALIAWAEEKGFKTTVPAEDMHVTILYSKEPVDWFDLTDEYESREPVKIPEGGPRVVEPLGDKGAIVLHFGSEQFNWRHRRMIQRGASHDYAEYQTHVTISYDAGDVDLSKIEPYTGPLEFGPEFFEEIEGYEIPFLKFEADELDAIDKLTERLCEDSNPVFAAMAKELRTNLEGVTTLEGARIAMLQAWERFDVGKLAEKMGLPLVTVRAAASIGEDDAVEA